MRTGANVLERIVAQKRREIRRDPRYLRLLERMIAEREIRADFKGALRKPGTRIIAEVKRASPSEGSIRDVDPVRQAKIYESAGAAAVSVLTDREFFGGSLEDLRRVRNALNVPLLRKDFILEEVQILEAKAFGADAVLLIVRILEEEKLRKLVSFAEELGLTPLVEVFCREEAELAVASGARVVGVNNRDLNTLRIDLSLTRELAPLLRELGAELVVSESGIETREQIEELSRYGVDAFLVGTALMKSEDPERKLRELLGIER